jgi:UDP-N-acetylglucosamine 4,6-dehydratase
MTRFWITLDEGVKFVLSCIDVMHGGEIFIPKLQTVRVVDLARAIGPNIPLRMVGIRPGEKIHETLISVDEARMTLELDDRYIIRAPLSLWQDRIPGSLGGQPVRQEFSFVSSQKELLMPADRILTLLG